MVGLQLNEAFVFERADSNSRHLLAAVTVLPSSHSLHRGMDAQIAAWGIV